MSVHSWGENPIGKWYLEIYNDAYTNWGSEAKFFRWSLKLYGTTIDPNSDEAYEEWYDESDERSEVERRILTSTYGHNHTERDGKPETTMEDTTSTSSTTARTTTTTVRPTVSVMRGCISTTINCTRNVSDCRRFTHRKVADIFCKCSPKLCLGVANFNNEFNLQCSISSVKLRKKLTLASSPKLPFYCQFIPFYNYHQKR